MRPSYFTTLTFRPVSWGHYKPRLAPASVAVRGGLEQYTASDDIKRFYQAASLPTAVGPVTIREIARITANGSTGPAASSFEEAGRLLGLGLASLVCIIDPQVIILGGGLIEASPLYFSGVCAAFQARAWPSQAINTVISQAKLGNMAAFIGGAALFLD